MGRYVTVAKADDLREEEVMVVQAGGRRMALCRVAGEIYCVDDVCTHDGGPLGEGFVIDHEIECPRHGARFDLRTGEVTALPATAPIHTYRARVQDGEVQVEVPE